MASILKMETILNKLTFDFFPFHIIKLLSLMKGISVRPVSRFQIISIQRS